MADTFAAPVPLESWLSVPSAGSLSDHLPNPNQVLDGEFVHPLPISSAAPNAASCSRLFNGAVSTAAIIPARHDTQT